MDTYRLSDLIDKESIRKITKANFLATGVSTSLVEIVDGSVLARSGNCEICEILNSKAITDIQPCSVFKNKNNQILKEKDVKIFRCEKGLYNISLPVFVSGKIIGILLFGQYFMRDEEKINFVSKIVIDEEKMERLSRAIEKIPVIDEERIDFFIEYNRFMVDLITNISETSILKRGYNKTLKDVETRYIKLAENSQDMLIRIGLPDGEFEYVNHASVKLTGYVPEEFYINSSLINEIVHPDWQNYFEDMWNDIRNGEIKETYEYKIINRNSSVKWVYQRNTIINDNNGSMIAVEGTLTDITKLKESEEALRENSKRYKSAQKMGNVGNWEFNLVNKDFWSSEQAKRIFGFDPENDNVTIREVRKRIVEKEKVEKFFQDLIENNKPYELEFEIILKDGSERIIRSIAEVVKDDNGNPVKFSGVLQDITNQRKFETDKIDLEQKLKQAQKMEAIGRLAGGVAHDFNNMLSIIIGNTEIMKYSLNESDPLVSNLNEIYEAAERSANLTRQLLTFARKQTIEPELLNINNVIENMHKMLERLIGEDINLVWNPCSNVDMVKIDPSQVDQLLVNLCVNARDAIKDVGVVTIETGNVKFTQSFITESEFIAPGDYVMLSVSDTGTGMDEVTRENLFEPFYTTKELGRGSGLGLSTVYGVVKQNNGYIYVYSEEDLGTTFRIYLPSFKFENSSELKDNLKSELKGGDETILVVEDEASILEMIRKILENSGYKVLTASSPTIVFELMKNLYKERIDLLITDVIMPKMNGKELSDKLSVLCPDMKTLFMSGYTANVIAHHGVLEKGIEFIHKPFSRTDFISKVRKVLDS